MQQDAKQRSRAARAAAVVVLTGAVLLACDKAPPATRAEAATVAAAEGRAAQGAPAGGARAAAPGTRAGDRNTLVALARLEPCDGVARIGAPLEDTIDRIVVKEGDAVAAAAPLAYLSSHALRAAESEALARKLKEAEELARAERARGAAAVAAAEVGIKRVKLGSFDVKVRESKVKLAEAMAEAPSAPAISQQGLLESRARLGQLRQSMLVEQLAAESQLRRARAEAARALAEIPVASLRADLAVSQARVEQTIVRAPMQGRILKIIAHPGERPGLNPVLQLGNTESMCAVAEVHQTDIARVRAGQNVVLSSPALPARLKGAVEHVGLLIYKNNVFGDDPNPPTNARVFEVKLRLASDKIAARFTNLEVNAEIELVARK